MTAPFVLFHLDTCLAFPGRQGWAGKHDRPMPYPNALKLLRELAGLKEPPEIGVIRAGTTSANLWLAIQDAQLEVWIKERNCFGIPETGRNETEELLKQTTTYLDVGNSEDDRIGIFVSRYWWSTEARKLGWRVVTDPCYVPHGLMYDKLPLFEMVLDSKELGILLEANDRPKTLWHVATIEGNPHKQLVLGNPVQRGVATHAELASASVLEPRLVFEDVSACRIVEVYGAGLTPQEHEAYKASVLAHANLVSPPAIVGKNIYVEKVATDRFLVIAAGESGRNLPHPPRFRHGHFVATFPKCPRSHNEREPDPLDRQLLTPEERDHFLTGMNPLVYGSLHAKLCGGREIRAGIKLDNRRVGNPGNLEATRFVARKFWKILKERRVYRQLPSIGAYPLYTVEGRIAGSGKCPGVVVVGAHLDSTASKTPQFREAPGADDDASGSAAVIYAARAIRDLMEKLQVCPDREIRFVLFNDEEDGLEGSSQYCEELAAETAASNDTLNVVAMIQLDMIGWRSLFYEDRNETAGVAYGPGTFRSDCTWLKRRSAEIQEVIVAAARDLRLSHLVSTADIPMHGNIPYVRSDHKSFWDVGIPAVLVAERGLEERIGDVGMPPRWNAAYHTSQDTHINVDMAFHLTQITAAAIWMMAKGRK